MVSRILNGPRAATFVLLVVLKAAVGLRVSPRVERSGLDLELHGETV